jgi:hypothetical protein
MAGVDSRFDDVYIRVKCSHYTGRRQVDAPTHACGMLSHRVFYCVAREAGRCISQPRSDSPAYDMTAAANTATSATSHRIHRPLDGCLRHHHLHHHRHDPRTRHSKLPFNYLRSSRSWPTSEPLDERRPQWTEGWRIRKGPEVRGRCLDVCYAAVPPRCLAFVSLLHFAVYSMPPAFDSYQQFGCEWESVITTVEREGGPGGEEEGEKEKVGVQGESRGRMDEGGGLKEGGGGGWRRRVRALGGRRARTERAGGGHFT